MAAEAVYVDLDLKGNAINNVKDAALGTDVPNLAQVEALLGGASHVPATAGTGIATIDPVAQVVGIADGGVGNLQLGANLYGLVDVERATTDPASATVDHVLTFDGQNWVGAELPPVDLVGYVTDVTGTAPITATETVPGTVVIGVDPAAFHVPAVAGPGIAPIDASQSVAVQLVPASGLSLVAAGLQVDTSDFINRSANGLSVNIGDGLVGGGVNADFVTVLADPAAGNALTVSAAGLFVPVTDTSTFATTLYVDTADAAINTRIDGLTITGDGLITVDSSVADTWALSVNSLALSNTYSGTTGVDSGTINADITAQGAVAEAGDIYINTATGAAFISTDGLAWVSFAPPIAAVTAVNGTAGEITSSNPTGPATTIALDTAITTAISDSTATNTTQDGRLDALETSTHVPAVAGSGIAPIDASQSVAIQLNNESGLSLVGGLQVDTGEFISRGADGLAVNIGDGLVAGGVGADSITVLAAPGGGIVVDATGVSVDASLVATPPVTLTFAPVAGGFEATATGPAGVATTVQVGGCVATLRVCDTAGTGAYTVFANTDPSVDGAVTLHFG